MISAVIPVYNEEHRIEQVLQDTRRFVDEIIVVDDASSDNTMEVAKQHDVVVLQNKTHKGYIASIKKGFQRAKEGIVVTLDADGEHDPGDIPRLVEPILKNKGDLALGVRQHVPRVSERILNWLTNRRVTTQDCGTGFRAMKQELAASLELRGVCTCGVLVLEAAARGARILDVPIQPRDVDKPRGIAWMHLRQISYVLPWLLKKH